MKMGLSVSFFLIFVSLLIAIPLMSRSPIDAAETEKKKSYNSDVGEGIVVSRHGIYGVDMVRCARARIQKVRRGPFVFGGHNELVLDDLSIVLPVLVDDEVMKTDQALTPNDVLSGLGVSKDVLCLKVVPVKFSGLRINRFSLAKLDSATNVVPVLTSSSAEAVRTGLKMHKCDIISGGSTNKVGEAMLRFGGGLVITWKNGKLEI